MKLVFATHNENKFKEVKKMLPSYIKLLSLTDINCHEDIKETASTIEGNAYIKARYIKDTYQLSDNLANIRKLLSELKNKKDRSARFKTAIALSLPDKEELFLGICKGKITTEQLGDNGFGYDPVFCPKGYERTFAQMSAIEKGEVGHRGKAIRLLVNYFDKFYQK